MKRQRMTLPDAIFLLIGGLIMGSIFVFGMRAWSAPIQRDACVVVDTEFASCRKFMDHSRIKEIRIDCTNGSRFFVGNECLNDELIEALDRLEPGDRLRILTRPNSNTILELTAGDTVLMELDTTLQKQDAKASGFAVLGAVMYLFAAVGAVNLLRIADTRKKWK